VKIFGLFAFGSCDRTALPPSAQARLRSNADRVHLKTLRPDVVQEVWRCFTAVLTPLRDQQKLGLVMSQFTRNFVPCRESFQRLQEICKQIAPTLLAAEFRSAEWDISAEAARVLKDLAIVCVHTDDNGSYCENNNSRALPEHAIGRDTVYCRIHRRPLSAETNMICENVTREEINAQSELNLSTGRFAGDLSEKEISEWAELLRRASKVMNPGGRIFVLFSTIGHNSSADNLYRLRIALGPLAAAWQDTSGEKGYLDELAVAVVDDSGREGRGSHLSSACPCEICNGAHDILSCPEVPKDFWETDTHPITVSASTLLAADNFEEPRKSRWGHARASKCGHK